MNFNDIVVRLGNIFTLTNIIHTAYIVLALSLVIVLHELGHYIAARIMGVSVEKFSLGFGPVLLKIKRKTEWVLSLIPLGGYVKMKGESPYDEEKPSADGFFSQSPARRSFIVIAGPASNFVLGFFIFFLTIWAGGKLIMQDLPKVGEVVPYSVAAKAGLETNDTILSINGKEMGEWDDLQKTIYPNAEKELTFVIERDGKKITKKITPKLDEKRDIGLIGIMPSYIRKPIAPHRAFIQAADRSATIVILTTRFLGMMIAGKIKAEVTGPIGIATMMNNKLNQGAIAFFELVALISLNLGLINLFPIPILDGGHVVIFAWEGLTKKFPSQKVYNVLQTIGMVFLLGIMLIATKNDLLNIFN